MSDEKKPAKNINVTGGDDAPAEDPKPVLITKRAILKSPTTAPPLDGNSTDAAAEPPAPMAQSIKKPLKPLIQPLADSPDEPAKIEVAAGKPAETEEKAADAAPAEEKPEPEAPAAKPADTDEPAKTPAKPEKEDSEEPDDSDTETADKKGGPTEEELNAEAEAKAKHDEAVQKLVYSKQYFLPINAVEKRKTKHFVILGLFVSVLLILAWGDIALDAGLIHVSGVKPVTHFFSN